jgi:hypothetical protein
MIDPGAIQESMRPSAMFDNFLSFNEAATNSSRIKLVPLAFLPGYGERPLLVKPLSSRDEMCYACPSKATKVKELRQVIA